MTVTVSEAKSKFSGIVSMAQFDKEEIIISKRDNPVAVLISYEKYLKQYKKSGETISTDDIKDLPSVVDKFVGAVSVDDIDENYKDSREDYLKAKYL